MSLVHVQLGIPLYRSLCRVIMAPIGFFFAATFDEGGARFKVAVLGSGVVVPCLQAPRELVA